MPGISVRYAERAATDLEAIKDWYAEQGVAHVGDRFVAEIMERVGVLRAHPEMGRIMPEFQQRFLRELIHPPFRIVYRREPGQVSIVRIWRSERLLRLADE